MHTFVWKHVATEEQGKGAVMTLRSDRRTAFTLIELLVVVAIIALLISILLPSLNQARKQARQLLCATNLRSQGQASIFYAEEHKSYIPCGLLTNNSGPAGPRPNHIEWGTTHWALLKYLNYTPDPTVTAGKAKIERLWPHTDRLTNAFLRMPQYQCPDHPDPESTLDYVSNAMPIPFSAHQAANSGLLEFADDDAEGVAGGSVDYYGVRRAQWSRLANPAKLIYVTGSAARLRESFPTSHLRFYAFFVGSQLPFAGAPRMMNDRRHPGGGNALFFDGHADTMSLNQMDPGWPNALSIRLQLFAPFDIGVEDP